MKPMLIAFNVFIFITLIRGAFTDIPSPIDGAEAALTIPAVLKLRGNSLSSWTHEVAFYDKCGNKSVHSVLH